MIKYEGNYYLKLFVRKDKVEKETLLSFSFNSKEYGISVVRDTLLWTVEWSEYEEGVRKRQKGEVV